MTLTPRLHLAVVLATLLFSSTLFAQEKIKLGVILPLSGEAASYGEQFKKGIDLSPGLNSFQVIFEDSKFEPKNALTAFYKLVDQDHVAALISFGGATCSVINTAAQKKKIIHLAAGCNIDSFKQPESFNFRMDVNEALAAEKTAQYLLSQKVKKVAFVYVANSWGEAIIDQTQNALQKTGVEIGDKISFDSSQAIDLHSSFAKLVLNKPQLVIFISLPNLTPIVLHQLKAAGYVGPIMSNISVENPEVIKLAGKDAEGIIYLAVKADSRSKPAAPIFYKAFPDGNPFAAWGYDSMVLLSEASRAADASDFLRNLKDFVGAFNSYNYDHSGELFLKYEIRQIKGGKYISTADQ